MTLEFSPDITISPVEEISAYEALWTKYTTPHRMGTLFEQHQHAMPRKVFDAEGLEHGLIGRVQESVEELLPFDKYTALFRCEPDFPLGLTELRNGPEVIYYQGLLDLIFSKCVAVVGARKSSEEGAKRARRLAKLLVDNNYTVMSGLAAGIDTAAHSATLEADGRTIAVLGTSLCEVYPKSNFELQSEIAKKHLLISQVPFYQTSQQDFRRNRFFFPERNRTMAALSVATIIVEASDTSGSLIQAREALKLNRKVFILNSCFESGLSWPSAFEKKGALRVIDGSEIIEHLSSVPNPNVQ